MIGSYFGMIERMLSLDIWFKTTFGSCWCVCWVLVDIVGRFGHVSLRLNNECWWYYEVMLQLEIVAHPFSATVWAKSQPCHDMIMTSDLKIIVNRGRKENLERSCWDVDKGVPYKQRLRPIDHWYPWRECYKFVEEVWFLLNL